ncbi:MAG: hypothetical protein GY743_24550 [Planctomycetaceae bacterium]|nr:hypothetical protein [Planctomycetaceae bacterium]
MLELTVPQPLATLAVEGVVKVLVVPEPPKCPECDGLGVVGWRVNVGTALAPVVSHPMCLRCIGDGLARWPAEVTIRSSEDEPEGPLAQPYRTDEPEPPAFWETFGCNADQVAGVELVDSPDGEWWQMVFPWGGEVVGTLSVEAAVPILGVDDIIEESCGWVSVFHRSAYLLLQSESGEHRHSDISDQIAFQDFHPGHTALILGGETDA